MPRMLASSRPTPRPGFLGHRLTLGPAVRWWCSTGAVEDLYRYATDTGAGHRPAWTAFNRRARRVPGAVGIWHETYEVARAESVYVDLPVQGPRRRHGAPPGHRRLDRAAARLAG
jgi:hypothetical protein